MGIKCQTGNGLWEIPFTSFSERDSFYPVSREWMNVVEKRFSPVKKPIPMMDKIRRILKVTRSSLPMEAA